MDQEARRWQTGGMPSAVRRAAARRTPAELPIALDRGAEAPLPVQLAAALRDAIDRGALRPGEALPATRGLAARLGVARGVAVAAYEQLIAEGYLLAGHGRGTVVHPELGAVRGAVRGGGTRAAQAPIAGRADPPSAVPTAARPGPLTVGVPDTSAVDTPAWRAAWRRAAARAHLEAPELGDPRLREEIAEHLRRMRGTQRPAADVIVTAGARDGLDLLLAALAGGRGRALAVGVEDPGYPSLRRVAARHSAEIVALPADAEGLDARALPERGLDAVIVTPSHQYPLGGSLPLGRRRELLAWAARTGAVIVEDDYDSELRHTGSPLPALAALDDPIGGSVALLGTFSKTVSPALSAGYLLAPAGLRAVIEPVRHELGGPVSAVVQAALAEYLASGELRRHTARMRRRYAARRELVVERLGGIAGVRVRPMSGGLHAVLEFAGDPGGGDPERGGAAEIEARICGLAADRRLGAVPLSAYWQRRAGAEAAGPASAAGPAGEGSRSDATAGRFGLVIGTGGPDALRFDRALRELRALLSAEFGAE